jgi:hypothetical protein
LALKSTNAQLLVNTGQFLDAELSFAELVNWVQDREEYWESLPPNSIVRVLADTIMLAAYEVQAGHRSPEELKELVSLASLQPAP